MSDPKAAIGASKARFQRHFKEWFRRHGETLWWLHSIYALALGIGVMWLGNRNFAYLRVAIFHIGFIWFSSLLLPRLLAHPRPTPAWASKLQLVVNYFNKNLYQQMLFFVLPIYYASSTFGSRNMGFVLLVGLSAILSTLDIIYDRHLSVKRRLTAGFFAFNLFALINVMLPILWSISNTLTTRVAGMVAFLAFLTLGYPDSPSAIRRIGAVVGAAVFILAVVELGRWFIPPAPLRLASAEFGTDFERGSLRIVSPVTELKPNGSLALFGLTAIKAPLGLREMLQHRWYVDGKLICASPFYDVVGGRQEGFRLWTSCVFGAMASRSEIRLDLETEGGQLVGRATLKSRG